MVARLVVTYLALIVSSMGQASEPMHLQASRVVFRLERLITRPGEANATLMMPVGSAFVVGSEGLLYLVTARHVAEGRSTLRARVPSKRTDNGKIEIVELRVPA